MSTCLPGCDEMLLVVQPEEIRDEVIMMGIVSNGIRHSRVPQLSTDK